MKADRRLRWNHHVFVPRERRARCSGAGSNEAADQSASSPPPANPPIRAPPPAPPPMKLPCRAFALTLLFFFVRTHIHGHSGDGSHLNSQRTRSLELALSLCCNHFPATTVDSTRERPPCHPPEVFTDLCQHTSKSIADIIFAGAQLFGHGHHYCGARRCCQSSPEAVWWWHGRSSSLGYCLVPELEVVRLRPVWLRCGTRSRRGSWGRRRRRRRSSGSIRSCTLCGRSRRSCGGGRTGC